MRNRTVLTIHHGKQETIVKKKTIDLFCEHRGAETGQFATCDMCGSKGERLPIVSCAIHERCTTHKRAAGFQWCKKCDDLPANKVAD